MKIIVATKETQGQRGDDFNFADEGEIVLVADCDHLHEGCGCERSMVGVHSGKGTTTMMVVEADMTREQFVEQIRAANKDYAELGLSDEIAAAEADALLKLAAEFPTGVVIERDGEDFNQRETIRH